VEKKLASPEGHQRQSSKVNGAPNETVIIVTFKSVIEAFFKKLHHQLYKACPLHILLAMPVSIM